MPCCTSAEVLAPLPLRGVARSSRRAGPRAPGGRGHTDSCHGGQTPVERLRGDDGERLTPAWHVAKAGLVRVATQHLEVVREAKDDGSSLGRVGTIWDAEIERAGWDDAHRNGMLSTAVDGLFSGNFVVVSEPNVSIRPCLNP